MNPFERLGLDSSASDGEVAAAFRKLAKATHPDSNPDDLNAASRFNEIKEAYESIKRMRCNNGRSKDQPKVVRDVQIEFPIDLETAYTGGSVTIPGSSGTCRQCNGSGFVRTAMRISCPTCDGRGVLRATKGILKINISCQDCGGTGHATKRKCSACDGRGTSSLAPATIEIPPGCCDGRSFLVENGADDQEAGFYGNLEVVIRVLPHETYSVEDNNLETTVSISVWTAALGGTIRVPALVGKDFMLKVPPGSQPGRRFRLKGRGMLGGDLIVTLAVSIPDASDGTVEKAFESLRIALDASVHQ